MARVFLSSLREITKKKGVKWVSRFLVVLLNSNFVLILLSLTSFILVLGSDELYSIMGT